MSRSVLKPPPTFSLKIWTKNRNSSHLTNLKLLTIPLSSYKVFSCTERTFIIWGCISYLTGHSPSLSWILALTFSIVSEGSTCRRRRGQTWQVLSVRALITCCTDYRSITFHQRIMLSGETNRRVVEQTAAALPHVFTVLWVTANS